MELKLKDELQTRCTQKMYKIAGAQEASIELKGLQAMIIYI